MMIDINHKSRFVEEPKAEKPKKEEVVVVEEPKFEKYTAHDLKQLSKDEQVLVLEDFGISEKAISKLKKESDRIETILELQG